MSDARIVPLKEELKFIHFADVLYWTAGAEVNRAARSEYFRRQGRVREIRTQFIMLGAGRCSINETGYSFRENRSPNGSVTISDAGAK